MKEFKRDNQLLSLCGLNCGLCTMRLSNHCPGCGGGPHHSCAIAKCSLAHNGVAYCFQCDGFPCPTYQNIDAYDSFITHLNQRKDLDKAKEIGIDAYNREQTQKVEILNHLLANYNAGRQKTFFCLAVNLLELEDLKTALQQIALAAPQNCLTLKEKVSLAVSALQEAAERSGLSLQLRKKTKR